MANSTISIAFRLDGDERGFKELTKSAEGLRTVMDSSVSVADRLSGRLVNFAAVSSGVQSAARAFGQLQSSVRGLTDAYAVQQAAETKLQQVMENRMGATSEEVSAVKELAAEQQRLGVISDEVQLAGAQQMAVYLDTVDSIGTLLPAMNDLIAQQEGLNATTGSAEAIAKAMGKAMEGQVGSLQRLGITFTDAQKNVMQFGTEEERAATLAAVIDASVGGMNATLAATDIGHQQQLANVLGDIKERIGGLLQGVSPFITMAAQAAQAAAGLTSLVTGFKTLTATIVPNTAAFLKNTAALVANKVAIVAQTVAQKLASAATKIWSGIQAVFNAIMSANPIALVVLAIAALVAAVVTVYKRCEAFRDAVKKVWDFLKPFVDFIKNIFVTYFRIVSTVIQTVVGWLKKLFGFDKRSVRVEVQIDSPDYNAEAQSIEEVERNIEILEAQLEGASKQEKNWLNDQIKLWKSKAAEIRHASAAAEENAAAWHETCLSLNDVQDNLNKLQDDLNAATTQEARDQIQKEIDALKKLQKSMQGASQTTSDTGKVYHEHAKSIKECEDNISILQDRFNAATTEKARAEAYAMMQANEALKKSYQDAAEAANASVIDFDANAKSIKGCRDNAEYYRRAMEEATDAETRTNAQANMELWTMRADDLQEEAKGASVFADAMKDMGPVFDENASTLKGYTDNISYLQGLLQTASVEEAAYINQSIALWQEKADAVRNAGKVEERAVMSAADAMRDGYSETKNLKGGIDSISDALTENGTIWDKVTGFIDGFLQIFDSFSSILEIIESLTAATNAQAEAAEVQGITQATASATAASAKAAEAGADIAEGVAAEGAATGEMTLAAAETFAAHASIPWVGIAMGAAMVAAMLATLLTLPKLASGGLATGPTLAMVGEYSGATSNPEVIAPLNRLRSMLRTDDQSYGQVEFKIEGRTLVGVLNRVNNLDSRR